MTDIKIYAEFAAWLVAVLVAIGACVAAVLLPVFFVAKWILG